MQYRRMESTKRSATPVISEETGHLPLRPSLVSTQRVRVRFCVVWVVVATLAFFEPLVALMRHAVASELLSYIPLVPLVAGYLLFMKRRSLPTEYRSSIIGTVVLCGMGAVALAAEARWRG